MNYKILGISLAFIILAFLIYYIVPVKKRYIVLFVFSVVGVAIFSTYMSLFLIFDIVITYCSGLMINKVNQNFQAKKVGLTKEEIKPLKLIAKKQKMWCVFFGVFFILLCLFILKYFNMMVHSFVGFFGLFGLKLASPVLKLALPIGISYYSLQSIGYILDVYRGKYQGDTNFLRIALFIGYFPQLFEGPFGRYDQLANQLYNGNEYNSQNVRTGILEFTWGILKIIFIANRAAIISNEIFKNSSTYGNGFILLGIFMFTIQLYAEFSGYVNIAKGVSKVFGVNLANNFEGPFLSQTISEFWRRWHISLGTWFRDYIFFSASMSKPMLSLSKKLRDKSLVFLQTFIPTALALLPVWFLTGLWHGARWKYVVYGLYYFVLMILGLCLEPLEKKVCEKTKISYDATALRIFRILRTFILMSIGMLLFRAKNLTEFGLIFKSIFEAGNAGWISANVIDVFDIVLLSIGTLIIFAENFVSYKRIDVFGAIAKQSVWTNYFVLLFLILTIVMLGAYGASYVPADPIYGAF